MRVLDVPDDRHVAYEVAGDPQGVPLFFQHGTGASRLCTHPDDSIASPSGQPGRSSSSRTVISPSSRAA